MKGSAELVSADESVDFSKLVHVTADDMKYVAAKHGPLGIAVVNTTRNGARVSFTKALHEALDSPTTIQFVTDGDYLYLGQMIPHSTESVAFSTGKGTNIIYARGFVNYLTSHFNLDFTACTSISFTDIEIRRQEHEGKQIIFAKIKMTKED
jgi:hypothetical protein